MFDEATEIKSLIKRPYQNLSPINRIALEKLFLKNSNFYKEYVSSNSKHFCHPAISPILIAAISFFNTCKELKIAQTTNNVSNDVNHIILMLGYGYPELFCPAVKQHNIGADIFKKEVFFIIYLLFKCSICLTDPDRLAVLKLRYTQVSVQAAL